MTIFVHDENSLSNFLVSELYQTDLVEQLLRAIKWQYHEKCPFGIKDIVLHHQFALSAFGKPDVMFVVTDNDGSYHIVILEVKTGLYVDSQEPNLEGGFFNNKHNSSINNQLTLRYRAFTALDSLENNGFLTEIEHNDASLYAHDDVRRCKHPASVKILNEIRAKPHELYLVALTNDAISPFGAGNKSLVMPLFESKTGESQFRNCGHLNRQDCKSVFSGQDNNFVSVCDAYLNELRHSENVTATEEVKRGGHDSRVIIREKKNGLYYYLSSRNYSYAIRKFTERGFDEVERGSKNKNKYEKMLLAYDIVAKAPKYNIDDVESWKNYFATMNRDPVNG